MINYFNPIMAQIQRGKFHKPISLNFSFKLLFDSSKKISLTWKKWKGEEHFGNNLKSKGKVYFNNLFI